MYHDLPIRTSYIKQFPAWHDKYGPVIRIEPNHLHIRDIEAYNQVYKMGTKFNKDPSIYDFAFSKGSLINEMNVKAARGHRDMYAPYFTRNAILNLEFVIRENLSTFLLRIDELAQKGSTIDLNLAFRCLTADTILKYVFDTNFGALQGPDGFDYAMVAPMEEFMAGWTLTFGWYFPRVMNAVASFCKAYPAIGRMNGAFKAALDQLEVCCLQIR